MSAPTPPPDAVERHPARELLRRGARFGVTTLSAVALNFGINIIGHECFGISVNILYPIALAAVTLSAFLQFRFFVYPGAAQRGALRQGSEFLLCSIGFRVLEWLLFLLLYNVVALPFRRWYLGCIVIVQGLGTVGKFFFYNFFVFGGRAKKEPSPSD